MKSLSCYIEAFRRHYLYVRFKMEQTPVKKSLVRVWIGGRGLISL